MRTRCMHALNLKDHECIWNEWQKTKTEQTIKKIYIVQTNQKRKESSKWKYDRKKVFLVSFTRLCLLLCVCVFVCVCVQMNGDNWMMLMKKKVGIPKKDTHTLDIKKNPVVGRLSPWNTDDDDDYGSSSQ